MTQGTTPFEQANDTLHRLRNVISTVSDVEPLSVMPRARIRSFGIDSVRMMDLLLSIEDEFGITLEAEDLSEVSTIEDLVRFVDRLSAE